MKKLIFTAGLVLYCVLSYGQDKVKYTSEERKALGEYLFNTGFKSPATQKLSTLTLKDGTVIKGYCKDVDRKKGQIYDIEFTDSVSGVKKDYPAEQIKEAVLFQGGFEKLGKVSSLLSNRGNMLNAISSKKKVINNDAAVFTNEKVSLKNKKAEQEFLMQLINPNFDEHIAVFFDPFADETSGVSIGGFGNIGGGVIKSYYVKKGDKMIWLEQKDFKDHYEFLFGDNADFMKKYPYKSVRWDWFSALIVEYSKLKNGSGS